MAGPLPETAKNAPHIERGQVAFARYCYKCHPGGEGGVGPALNNKPLPAAAIENQVRLGLGVMPAFDRQTIPPDELSAIASYLEALRHEH